MSGGAGGRLEGLARLLGTLVERRGSDLHLLDGVVPKVRVHGALQATGDVAVDVAPLVLPLLDERQAGLFETDGQVDFSHAEGGSRFRVNAFRHRGGVGAVFRLIPDVVPTLEELNIPSEVAGFTDFAQGLVLVTGPTGSGKSSTLAALLGAVNRSDARHVVTIEDPIEFVHADDRSWFAQREIGRHAESFGEALRSAARQDPDVVLVGEMRDHETIAAALTLAETGTLVMSTLHTSSAGRTIDRIVEVFPDAQHSHVRSLLAGSLCGVLSQVLCRRADGEGRVPATELLLGSSALSAMIREGTTHKVDALFQSGRRRGMHRLDDSLHALMREGTITREEARRNAADEARFAAAPGRSGEGQSAED